jgi:hypothetical protein
MEDDHEELQAAFHEERKSIYKRSKSILKILTLLKSKTPCKDCGTKFPPESMDFDHVRGKKLFNMSNPPIVANSTIIEELRKCEIVCSNCHRTRTKTRARKIRELRFRAVPTYL